VDAVDASGGATCIGAEDRSSILAAGDFGDIEMEGGTILDMNLSCEFEYETGCGIT
tara:strand:+ start:128 stop:295 length:168 start_codon:yes stop_codon:yes gene_type:complete